MMGELFLKAPLIYVLKLIKWSSIFALMIATRIALLSHFDGFSLFLLETLKMVCTFFPAISTFTFIDTLIFLMKNKNTSYAPFFTVLIILLLIDFALQPLLYSITQNMPASQLQELDNSSMYSFIEPPNCLKTLTKDVYIILDDARQVYFEGYTSYLFFVLSYTFFLFSFSIFTLKTKWNLFNIFIMIVILLTFIRLYSIMNSLDNQLYIFSFSTNQLKGIPTYIITIGLSSFLYLYGIFFRIKWDGKE